MSGTYQLTPPSPAPGIPDLHPRNVAESRSRLPDTASRTPSDIEADLRRFAATTVNTISALKGLVQQLSTRQRAGADAVATAGFWPWLAATSHCGRLVKVECSTFIRESREMCRRFGVPDPVEERLEVAVHVRAGTDPEDLIRASSGTLGWCQRKIDQVFAKWNNEDIVEGDLRAFLCRSQDHSPRPAPGLDMWRLLLEVAVAMGSVGEMYGKMHTELKILHDRGEQVGWQNWEFRSAHRNSMGRERLRAEQLMEEDARVALASPVYGGQPYETGSAVSPSGNDGERPRQTDAAVRVRGATTEVSDAALALVPSRDSERSGRRGPIGRLSRMLATVTSRGKRAG